MNKFLLSLLKFFIYSLIVYIILIFIWGRFAPNGFKPNLNYRIGSYGHMHSRIQEVKETQNVDILFLGSSHTYRGFDPRIFKEKGFSSFNLGSSAQTPLQTKILLNRYLDQLNPKTIIYEVYPTTFSIDGVESSLDVIANDDIDKEMVNLAFRLNNLKVYNTLLYGMMCQSLGLDSDFEEPIKRRNDTYINNGYVEKELAYFKYEEYKENQWKFNETQFQAFEEILKLIEGKNIKLILVNAPMTSSLYDSYSNNTTFDSLMINYGEYHNFNSILNLDDSLHFYDSNHLNQVGVEIFNATLIEKLLK